MLTVMLAGFSRLDFGRREIINFHRHFGQISPPSVRFIGKFQLYPPEYHLQGVCVTVTLSEARREATPHAVKTALLVLIYSGFIIIKCLVANDRKSCSCEGLFGVSSKNIYPNSEYHNSEMIMKPTTVLRNLLEFHQLYSKDLIIDGCDIFLGLLLLYLEITWRGE